MNVCRLSSILLLITLANVSLAKNTFKITAMLNKPWLMLKEDSNNRVGNDRFEGFLVDLLDRLAEKFNVNYELNLQPDSRYGIINESTGKWEGMIGSVIDGEADLAVGDITITAAREKAVDFTIPFMQTGITILYSKSAWKIKSFNNIEDLVNQDSIEFGCVRGGATERFFKNSPNELYNKVWEKMNTMNKMTNSNAEGVELVLENPGDYAYLIESTSADWEISQNCNLQKIGGDINVRNYGIAIKQGSKLRKDLNVALLEMMEAGELSQLKNKWWKKNDTCDVLSMLSTFAGDVLDSVSNL